MVVASMNIERRPDLTQQEFINGYLRSNVPLIVTAATKDWNMSWDLEHWAERFGEEPVQIYDDLFTLMDVDSLSSYLDRFTGEDAEQTLNGPQPYVRWYSKMKDVDFVWADSVFERISRHWHRPRFLPESNYLLPYSPERPLDPTKDLFPGRGLFISGKGARTRLHCDPWASDAVLCQLFGSKKIVMFSPGSVSEKQGHEVTSGGSDSSVEADKDRMQRSPDFEDILKPNEILYIPHGWYHAVESLTDSVSLTWNFVHQTTGVHYLRYLMSPESGNSRDVLGFFLNPIPGIH
jgi:hypothetical protein